MRSVLAVPALLLCASPFWAQTEFKYKVAQTLRDAGRVESLAFCTGDKTAYAGAADGSMLLINLTDGTSRRVASGKHAVESVDCSRDGSMGAGGAADGTIWLSRGGGAAQALGAKGGHHGLITSIKFSPQGEFLVSAGHDKGIIVWEPNSGQKLFSLPNPSKGAVTLAGFSAGGGSLIGITEDGDVLEWDLKTRNVLSQRKETGETIQGGRPSLYSATVSFDGKYFAIGKEITQLPRGVLGSGAGMGGRIPGPAGGSSGGAAPVSPGGSSAPPPGAHTDPSGLVRVDSIRVFGLPGLSVRKPIPVVDGQLIGISISADNGFLAGARRRQKGTYLSIYDLQEGIEKVSLPIWDGSKVAEFSPGGGLLATVGAEGYLQILEIEGVRGTGVCVGCGPIRLTSSDTAPLITAERPVVIAIVDLQPLQVTPELASAVADMLRTQISGTKDVTMVERQRMPDVTKEQGFQYSDLAKVAVRLGQLLGANKMLFGSLSKLGSKYTITVRMVDVESGAISGIRAVECECPEQNLSQAVSYLRDVLVSSRR